MSNDDTIPKRVRSTVNRFGNCAVQWIKNRNDEYDPVTYREMWTAVEELALACRELGVRRGDHVGLMSDNRGEWLLTDLALLSIGAADVPRGSDSTDQEIAYILAHADCKVTFAEDDNLARKILHHRDNLPQLHTIVVFDHDQSGTADDPTIRIIPFSHLASRGTVLRSETSPGAFDEEIDTGSGDDVATILYTSGTTGEPKGVLLPHRSFAFQIDRVKNILGLDETDIFLSVLPIWHSFERAVEYIVLGYAASIAYSRPIGKIMLADIARLNPTWMTSVPRIWESIYSTVIQKVSKESPLKRVVFQLFLSIGIAHAHLRNLFRGLVPNFTKRSRLFDRLLSAIPLLLLAPLASLGGRLVFKSLKNRLGSRFVAGVSGGGALPPHIDRFFQAAGIKLLEGYGLTETGPILAVRPESGPVPGTVGRLLPDIEFRVVGEGGEILGPNQKGVLFVRSPQVMLGYYKKPDETAQVLNDGWLNTGDLVRFSHDGDFTVIGRVKETIVLLGGENVEPTPIEETLVQSEFIEQAMVVGQDQKFLGALIVPNFDRLAEYACLNQLSFADHTDLIDHDKVRELFNGEIHGLVNHKKGFKSFEQIFRFAVLPRSFAAGEEITLTLKKKRDVITSRFRKEIEALYR
ncbi:MAG TPA: AMP-binding protein [Spirochaetia bacterium]|nr:AMP-binding protein [Spirochaetia bacterium]